LWVQAEASAGLMPLDAEPITDGNVLLTGATTSTMGGGRIPVARVEASAPLFDDGAPRYRSHFVTCPHADEWRRRQ
jgi:hypothetical protein